MNVIIKTTQNLYHTNHNKLLVIKWENLCAKLNYLPGTGFFCMIPFPNKFSLLPVLITNNHVIGEDPNSIFIGAKVNFYVKKGDKSYQIILDKNRKVYTNEKIDVTINAIIERVDEDDINITHFCSSSPGSSGGPLLNLFTHKVIGIYKGYIKGKKWNVATLIHQAIKEFNQKFNDICNKINVINETKNESNDTNYNKININENFDEITIRYQISNVYLIGNLFG